jgi:hypothetical protein
MLKKCMGPGLRRNDNVKTFHIASQQRNFGPSFYSLDIFAASNSLKNGADMTSETKKTPPKATEAFKITRACGDIIIAAVYPKDKMGVTPSGSYKDLLPAEMGAALAHPVPVLTK